ncbi:ferredoxin--NADP reductase [Dongshaea marina]|uniref:ferredoxin--NADP reductase n=1 Tax=Dongshaea marina TaxID=2047966 RepID=UPI000D3E202F|nr:ferredoxin--NADP reductase [Dongshaea marina]
MANWIEATVTENHHWNPQLFSLKISAPLQPHLAGQFVKLALDEGDKRVARAYSFVNAPDNRAHEFLIIEIDDGALTPKLNQLKPGDRLWVTEKPQGYLTLDELPEGKDLWLLATGTGLGPFLSILQESGVWERFSKINLVHGVRFATDLAYQPLIAKLQAQYPDRLSYVPVVSRESHNEGLSGRIPAAIESGALESYCDTSFTPDSSQVMICGNPAMVKDAITVLKLKGLTKNLRRKPGNITVEQYW